MDYIKEFMKANKLEDEQVFKIERNDKTDSIIYSMCGDFFMRNNKLYSKNSTISYQDTLMLLLTGQYKINKGPFVPKLRKRCWTIVYDREINDEPVPYNLEWCNDTDSLLLLDAGLIFETEKEAIAAIPHLLETMERIEKRFNITEYIATDKKVK